MRRGYLLFQAAEISGVTRNTVLTWQERRHFIARSDDGWIGDPGAAAHQTYRRYSLTDCFVLAVMRRLTAGGLPIRTAGTAAKAMLWHLQKWSHDNLANEWAIFARGGMPTDRPVYLVLSQGDDLQDVTLAWGSAELLQLADQAAASGRLGCFLNLTDIRAAVERAAAALDADQSDAD